MRTVTALGLSLAVLAGALGAACSSTAPTDAPATSVPDAGDQPAPDSSADGGASDEDADAGPSMPECLVDGFGETPPNRMSCSVRAEGGVLVLEGTSKVDDTANPADDRDLVSISFQTVSTETAYDVHFALRSLTGAKGSAIAFDPGTDSNPREVRVTVGDGGAFVGRINCGPRAEEPFEGVLKEGIAVKDVTTVVVGAKRDGDALTLRLEHDGTVDQLACPPLVKPGTYPKLTARIFDSHAQAPGPVRATIDDFTTSAPACVSSFDAPLKFEYTCQ